MRPERGTTRRLGWAAGSAALALLAGGCGLSLQQLPKIGGIGGPTYAVKASFSNVLNLPANAQVREGAAVIGEVGSIDVENFAAVITLDIKKNVQLSAGTTAQVRFDNPLGEEYVVLTPPSQPTSGQLTAGSMIPETATNTAPSVEDTLGALATVLNGGGIAQLGTIIRELNNTFAGNQPQIRSLLGEINVAVSSLAGSSGAIDGALAAIGNLFKQFNAGSNTIVNGIKDIGPATALLADENGQFSQLIDKFGQLSTTALAVAQQSGHNSVEAVDALDPVVNQIVGVESQLAPDLLYLEQFESNAHKVAPGNYLQVSVTATVNLNSKDIVATEAANDAAASVAAGTANGTRAVAALLEAGVQ